MESKFYRLTQMNIRRLAYQLAVRNNIASSPYKRKLEEAAKKKTPNSGQINFE